MAGVLITIFELLFRMNFGFASRGFAFSFGSFRRAEVPRALHDLGTISSANATGCEGYLAPGENGLQSFMNLRAMELVQCRSFDGFGYLELLWVHVGTTSCKTHPMATDHLVRDAT